MKLTSARSPVPQLAPLLSLLVLGAPALSLGARSEPAWRYEVEVGPRAEELLVEAQLEAGSPATLSVDDGAEPFVRDVAVEEGGRWLPIPRRNDAWRAPQCTRHGCRLRYRFLLDAAARALASESAEHLGELIQAPPSTWLLRPWNADGGRSFRFRVRTPPGLGFATGVHAVAGTSDTYEADVSAFWSLPYTVFGPLRVERLERQDGLVDLVFLRARRQLPEAELARWIGEAAEAVGRYYGRFPLERVLILVLPTGGNRFHGRTLGGGGAGIRLEVGVDVDRDDLERDWVLVHELVHLAFPSVPYRHHWIEEGLSTYIEPLVRVRAGQISPAKVWSDLLWGLPQGLPEPGDEGLDHTPTWGRTYWGGALFCFIADLRIRQRTENRRSLGDALRGILAAGGDITTHWSLERALAEGDRATGTKVLRELHAEMGARAVDVDLRALWKKLGVRLRGRTIVFDDDAPWAALRRAITE